MKQSLVVLGALMLVLTGCVKEEGIVLAPDSEAVDTTTSSASSSSPAPDPSRLQPFGTKLTLGEAGTGLEVTAAEIDQDSAPTIMPPGGGHWASARVQTCLPTDASAPFTVGSSEWSATDASGTVYNASTLTEVGFPAGLFPTASTLAPGKCAAGWVMFPVGFRALLTAVTFTHGTATKATWAAPAQ